MHLGCLDHVLQAGFELGAQLFDAVRRADDRAAASARAGRAAARRRPLLLVLAALDVAQEERQINVRVVERRLLVDRVDLLARLLHSGVERFRLLRGGDRAKHRVVSAHQFGTSGSEREIAFGEVLL